MRLGLPAEGPGSVVGFGPRLAAFLVDAFVANLIAGIPYLFGARYSADARGSIVFAAFLLEELALVTATGQTFGMRLLGLRVIRLSDRGLQNFPWILARTVLLGLLIPALIWDRDRRGLHDKAAGTVVVRDPQRGTGSSRSSTDQRGSGAEAKTRADAASGPRPRSAPRARQGNQPPARPSKQPPTRPSKQQPPGGRRNT